MAPPQEDAVGRRVGESSGGSSSSSRKGSSGHSSGMNELMEAEAEFRSAVQGEQAALMASGLVRTEATEVLLGRLRDRGTDGGGGTGDSGDGGGGRGGGVGCASTDSPGRGGSGATPDPEDSFSPLELTELVEVHGYSREDARRALTICQEMRRLESEGVGGVAAARELTRRVLGAGKTNGDRGGGSEGGPETQSADAPDVAGARVDGVARRVELEAGGRTQEPSVGDFEAGGDGKAWPATGVGGSPAPDAADAAVAAAAAAADVSGSSTTGASSPALASLPSRSSPSTNSGLQHQNEDLSQNQNHQQPRTIGRKRPHASSANGAGAVILPQQLQHQQQHPQQRVGGGVGGGVGGRNSGETGMFPPPSPPGAVVVTTTAGGPTPHPPPTHCSGTSVATDPVVTMATGCDEEAGDGAGFSVGGGRFLTSATEDQVGRNKTSSGGGGGGGSGSGRVEKNKSRNKAESLPGSDDGECDAVAGSRGGRVGGMDRVSERTSSSPNMTTSKEMGELAPGVGSREGFRDSRDSWGFAGAGKSSATDPSSSAAAAALAAAVAAAQTGGVVAAEPIIVPMGLSEEESGNTAAVLVDDVNGGGVTYWCGRGGSGGAGAGSSSTNADGVGKKLNQEVEGEEEGGERLAPGGCRSSRGGRDTMEVSSPSSLASFQMATPYVPVAKRQRYQQDGVRGGDAGSRREREPRSQVVCLEQRQQLQQQEQHHQQQQEQQQQRQRQQEEEQKRRRQEEQELQLQLAFHRMGVRQRSSPPSPPLISALPPKRPRTPGDDHPHGKRPRNN